MSWDFDRRSRLWLPRKGQLCSFVNNGLLAGGAAALGPLSVTVDGTTNQQTSSTTLAYTVAGTTPAGTLAVVLMQLGGSSPSAFVDSKSNTWTQDATYLGGSNNSLVYHSILTTALVPSDTITCTLAPAGTRRCLALMSVANAALAALDQQNGGVSTASAPTVSTSATTNAKDAVFATYGLNTITSLGTEMAGWTTIMLALHGSANNFPMGMAYKLVTATGVQTYTPNGYGSVSWTMAVAAFKGQ